MEKKKNNTNSEIEKKRKEIEKLKKELEAKKEVFEMLKNGEDEELIKEKFTENLYDFYRSFNIENCNLIVGEYHDYFEIRDVNLFRENIKNKLLLEEKKIEEKEIRLENLEYIKLQKNVIDVQNERTFSLNLLTSVLALGVLVSIINIVFIGENKLFLIGIFCLSLTFSGAGAYLILIYNDNKVDLSTMLTFIIFILLFILGIICIKSFLIGLICMIVLSFLLILIAYKKTKENKK